MGLQDRWTLEGK